MHAGKKKREAILSSGEVGEGAYLFDLLGLEYYLEDLYGVPVNVFSGRALHPMMKDDVLKDTHRSIYIHIFLLWYWIVEKASVIIKRFLQCYKRFLLGMPVWNF